MNIDTLRRRVIARFRILPEILYAITRHWMILVFCVGTCTAIMVAKVSTDPVIYEGKAAIMLSANESMVVEQDRRRDDRENAASFFSSRVEMLSSDSVLRKVVQELQPTNILNQEINLESQQYGFIRKKIQAFKDEVSDLLNYLEHPNMNDVGEEMEMQKAINSLRRRVRIIPSAKTAAVELRLYGNNYDRIQRELDAWIESYRVRLVEMSTENKEKYLESRSHFWQKKEDEAKAQYEEFKKNHPDVSQASFEQLTKQLDRFEEQKEKFERDRDVPPVRPLLEEPSSNDPRVQGLLRERSDLEQQIASATVAFGPESLKVRDLKATLRNLEERLSGVSQPEIANPDERRSKLIEVINTLTTKITELRAKHAEMNELRQKLKEYEDEYKQNQKVRQDYQLMGSEEADRMELGKKVQVQVTERPTVVRTPYNTYPHRQVLYGTVGGIVLGLGLALVLELLSNKVRFKNDVITEFGIPVVGVIPRK